MWSNVPRKLVPYCLSKQQQRVFNSGAFAKGSDSRIPCHLIYSFVILTHSFVERGIQTIVVRQTIPCSSVTLFNSPKSTSCPPSPSRSRYPRLSFCPVRSKSRTRPSRWFGLARQNAPSFRPNPHSSRGGLSSPHLARQSLWTRTPNHRRKRRQRTAESSQGRSVASCWVM